jgi:hypothetical protein
MVGHSVGDGVTASACRSKGHKAGGVARPRAQRHPGPQVLGAIAQFDKATLVAKLKAA